MMTPIQLHVRLTDAQKLAIAAERRRTGASKAEIVRRALDRYLGLASDAEEGA